jgi:hypothetical protein
LSNRVSAWRRRGPAKAFERVSTEEAPEQVTGPKGEWERVPEMQEVATAHAFTSMAILGHKMDQGISPSSMLQQLEKPHVAWFVKTGELALGTNRKR